jgi:diacylglycerol kinase (ATP)
MQQPQRVTAVVNPAAGGDTDRILSTLDSTTVHTVRTSGAGDAADLAYKLATQEQPPDLVVAVGGDGTVCEVVTGLHRAGTAGAAVPPLLVAPAGTGNSTYRGLCDDAPWEAVAGQALRGEAVIRPLDLGRVTHNDHLVVLGSGSGLFAESLAAIKDRPERGRDLLMKAAAEAMARYRPYPGRVSVDGETFYEGGIVETIIGGFRYRGGLLNLVPKSIVDDGWLDVTVVTAAVDMAEFAQAAQGGMVYDVPGILHGRGSRIGIARTDGQPLLWEHDGELMPPEPAYEIAVLPGAVRVLTPVEAPVWFEG